jgi:hypothetical protein
MRKPVSLRQYAVEYWGFMTILAESEEESRAKFAAVDHGEDSDYAEITTIDYMCDVEKRAPREGFRRHVIRWIRRRWNLDKVAAKAWKQ